MKDKSEEIVISDFEDSESSSHEDTSSFNHQVDKAVASFKEQTLRIKKERLKKLAARLKKKKQKFKERLTSQVGDIIQEKRDWIKEKEAIAKINTINESVVQLNVSGVTKGFLVAKDILCSVPNSALEAMFSGRHELKKEHGAIYLSRNPKVFELVIDYLRNNQEYIEIEDKYLKQLFFKELRYLSIPIPYQGQIKEVQEKVFNKEPHNPRYLYNHDIIETWRELKPFDAYRFVKEGKIEFDEVSGALVLEVQYVDYEFTSGFADADKKLRGFGRIFYSNYSRHTVRLEEGFFANDLKDGFRRIIYHDKSCYVGQIKNHQKHGYGRFDSATGETQEGVWVAD